ncbi:hypothetical protein IP69_19690 [Bosea sp. AAP35]|uniref:sensor domain-containing diguanylate cyclase n=1 Tax=Bosea sp. AAP35 TaxID=1523417 RepID=UPI0006B88AF2|nr:sensor domain-containing diguanylate cyclase [Bosea sp. AAP35]KPF62809.1 hypothetical protein IP69_19690 [Bosea sp. AAP35]
MVELLLIITVAACIGWWRAVRLLARSRALLRDVVEGMPDGFILWDANDRLVAWSDRVSDVYTITGPQLRSGLPFEELLRRGVEMGQYPAAAGREDEFIAEMTARHRATGTTECQLIGDRWMRIREMRTPSGGIIGLRTEITDLKRALADAAASRAAVEHVAHHDALTDLANRRLFLKKLGRALRERDKAATLFMDLDGFKLVNDRLGHLAGDSLLRAVAARLLDVVPSDSVVARLGGDEFAVLVGPGYEAEVVARRIVEAIARPFDLNGEYAELGASVGLAHARSGEKAEELMRRADEALYSAKRAGGRCVRLYPADAVVAAA